MTILGNISQMPELRYTPSGMAVCTLSVATNHSVKNSDGSYKDIPTFHNVVVFGKKADFVAKECKKGDKVYIEGRLQNRSWDDPKTNTKKYRTETIADEIIPMARQRQTSVVDDLSATPPQKEASNQEEINLDDMPDFQGSLDEL